MGAYAPWRRDSVACMDSNREPNREPNREAAAAAIDAFVLALGLDPERHPDLQGTGARVAAAFLDEFCAGYTKDAAALVREQVLPAPTAAAGSVAVLSGPIVLRHLPLTTMCPHHLLPAVGSASVAFQPKAHLLGLGVVPDLLNALGARLVLQEALTEEVVSILATALDPQWIMCSTHLSHGCMNVRGPRTHGAQVNVVAMRGSVPDAILASLLHA